MRGVFHIPGRHPRQSAGLPSHGAIALAGGEKLQPLAIRQVGLIVVGQLIAHHGGVLTARDVDHVLRIGHRLFQKIPGAARLGEAGRVGRVPARRELLFQIGPKSLACEIRAGRIERQQFQKPRKTVDDANDFVGAVVNVEQAELGLGRVVAGQPAHGFVRAEVRRAQHHEAAVGQADNALPQRRAAPAVGDHRTHHQPSHRVRDDMHRLALLLDLRQQDFQLVGQLGRRFAHRQPPVVRENFHPVTARQKLQQWSVKIVQQIGGVDVDGAHL